MRERISKIVVGYKVGSLCVLSDKCVRGRYKCFCEVCGGIYHIGKSKIVEGNDNTTCAVCYRKRRDIDFKEKMAIHNQVILGEATHKELATKYNTTLKYIRTVVEHTERLIDKWYTHEYDVVRDIYNMNHNNDMS